MAQGKSLSTEVEAVEIPQIEKPNTSTKRPFWRRPLGLGIIGGSIIAIALIIGLAVPLSLKHASSADSSSDSTPASSNPSSNTNSTSSPTPNASALLSVGSTFDLALGYTLNSSTAQSGLRFYTTDLFNTPASEIAALIAANHTVACYFSAGSVESYRPDSADFPAAAVGKVMKGWSDERWVDTRAAGVRAVMQKRIDMAAAKGCHGIDADNIDGYENDTGFALSQDDGVSFVRWLADAARAKGLLYGLKNGGAIVGRVLDVASWDIQEECVATNECAQYKPFVDAGKPVFHVEYTDDQAATEVDADWKAKACAAGGVAGISTVIKHMKLDSWLMACP